jgi:hypothetical protein
MSTKLNQIKVIGDLHIEKATAPLKSIAESFHGIDAIHFCDGTVSNFISVYTKNLGSVHAKDLLDIQNKLKANSLSISTVQVYFKGKGLIYILQYSK